MSFYTVQGNPEEMPMTLQRNGSAFVLDEDTDTLTLRYIRPDGTIGEKTLEIVSEAAGTVKAVWDANELTQTGHHSAQIQHVRNEGTEEAPVEVERTFPNDGNLIVWPVYAKI